MVLFEDKYFIVAEKLPGEICEDGENSVLNRLKNNSATGFLQCANRLDRPVFGVFIAAKSPLAMQKITQCFAEKKVKKTYIAIVENVFENTDWQTAQDFLGFSHKAQKAFVAAEKSQGKSAVTKFRIFGHCDKFSFAEVLPLTGKTHQIRVQLASRGFVIKGDLKYGAKRSDKNFPIRLFSREIEFVHPFSGENLKIAADFPKNDALWELCAENFAKAQKQNENEEN